MYLKTTFQIDRKLKIWKILKQKHFWKVCHNLQKYIAGIDIKNNIWGILKQNHFWKVCHNLQKDIAGKYI